MKPWISEPRGRQLEAFVGTYGVKTGQFETSEELIDTACRLFGVDQRSVEKSVELVAEIIDGMGKKARSEIAHIRLTSFSPEQISGKRSAPVTEEALEKMMADSLSQMVDGAGQDCVGELDIDPAKLLLKVVSAVIGAGQAHILYDFPEVLKFTRSRIPSRAELAGHTGIDERMFEAKAKWPNLIPGTQI